MVVRYHVTPPSHFDIAISAAALLGGVIREHPRRPGYWVCYKPAEEGDPATYWPSKRVGEETQGMAALIWLISQGYTITQDGELRRASYKLVTS